METQKDMKTIEIDSKSCTLKIIYYDQELEFHVKSLTILKIYYFLELQ